MKHEDEEYEDKELEGFCFEDDIKNMDINDVPDEQLEVWLDFQPFYYRWISNIGKIWGHADNIYHIIVDLFIIMFYKFASTTFYRNIFIAFMISGATLYWIIMFGQEDISVLDGDTEKVIFHLPSV